MIQLTKGCHLFFVGKSILIFSPLQWQRSQCDVAVAPMSDIWDCVNTQLKIHITGVWVLTVARFLQAGFCCPLLSCTSLSHSNVSLAQYCTIVSAGFSRTWHCWGQRLSEVVKWKFEDLIQRTDLAQHTLICTSRQPGPSLSAEWVSAPPCVRRQL